jgi:Concanavalin A-like lectin/glucanases superfamily
MSLRWPNSIVNKTFIPPTGKFAANAPGLWKLNTVAELVGQALWPVGTAVEDVFSTYLYTGNGSTQDIQNGIALGNANDGGSVSFPGTSASSGISYAANTAFQAASSFTIEFWFRFDANPSSGFATLFSIGDNSPKAIRAIRGNDGNIYVSWDGGTSMMSIPSSAWTLGVWYHLAIVRNGSSSTVVYLNGVNRSSGTFSGTIGNYPLSIGIWNDTSNWSFNGKISNFRFVKGTAVYTADFTPPTAALTAISGTSLLVGQNPLPLKDYSTNAFVPTNYGLATTSTIGPFTGTAGKGGLVWLKSRNQADPNYLEDTARGATYYLSSNTTNGQSLVAESVKSFNSNGFTIGSTGAINTSGNTYASWTFRKAPKFFDVVTYTGNGVAGRQIAHSLGIAPGMVIVKRTDTTGNWAVYHRSLASAANFLLLDTTDAVLTNNAVWNSTAPTASVFTVGTAAATNANGGTYVAYLFAHDTTTDGLIQCGSYTGTGTSAAVALGWEPQYVLVKQTNAADDWFVFDNMRGMSVQTSGAAALFPNKSNAEVAGYTLPPTATGFMTGDFRTNGATYIYMAIRRGPMRTPTDPTKVFIPNAQTAGGNGLPTFPSDFLITGLRGATSSWQVGDRLRGFSSKYSSWVVGQTTANPYLVTSSTNAETTSGARFGIPPDSVLAFLDNNNMPVLVSTNPTEQINYFFKRAPGFFDVVCYTGTGAATTQAHNLGVAPELMIVKRRNASASWQVYVASLGNAVKLVLEESGPTEGASTSWNNTSPTASVFSLGTDSRVNGSGGTYVAYLFASCPGVSKVGSYIGSGSTQTISCGFTGGARFVLIKRTDSTGNWFVWDTARGMVAGTDPRLALNSTAAESNNNWIYSVAGGFQIVTTDASVNAGGGSYIYLAIA